MDKGASDEWHAVVAGLAEANPYVVYEVEEVSKAGFQDAHDLAIVMK